MKIKRAQGTTLTWAVVLPCILVLMVGFILVATALAGKNKNEINFKESVENLDSQRELMKILNSPVKVSGEVMSVKELINLTFFDEEKYEDVLESEMKKILVEFQYDYVDFQRKDLRERGFSFLIYSEKQVKGELPKELIRIASERFENAPCVSDVQGCRDLAGVYIPVSETNMGYVILRGSEGAKQEVKNEK